MASENQDPVGRVQAVIHAFARKYSFLHEMRIQKLLFWAEYMSLEKRGKPLLGIPFKRYHYGVYSDAVNLALTLDQQLRTAADETPDGEPTVTFLPAPDLDVTGLTREELDLIEAAHEWTKKMTNEELAAFGKATTAWEATKQGEEIDLEKAAQEPGFRTSPKHEAILLKIKQDIDRGDVLSYPDEDALMKDLGLD